MILSMFQNWGVCDAIVCGRGRKSVVIEEDEDFWKDLLLYEAPPPPPIPRIISVILHHQSSPFHPTDHVNVDDDDDSLIGLDFINGETEVKKTTTTDKQSLVIDNEDDISLEATTANGIPCLFQMQQINKVPYRYKNSNSDDDGSSYSSDFRHVSLLHRITKNRSVSAYHKKTNSQETLTTMAVTVSSV